MFRHPLTPDATLRPLEPWQAAEFAAYVDRARPHLAPWLPWAETIVDESSARAWLQRYADRQADDSGRVYGIWVSDSLVGGTLFRVFDTQSGLCEVGVWLDPAVQGRGLVGRAVEHMVEWAFRERGMHRVEWRVVPTNTRSITAAKRLGMTRDGVLREVFPFHGTRHDIEVWSLLATEWRSPEAPPA
ncbi:GNAT family protein [Plantactinospora mayteni]|uniref:N-acetyltransferase n=1 Tax=Plantactinospora mayteni TaxID=566021 RepID=A0ABQ4EXJ1_9ACTN|nr:GNAT family protein [Plantactinospora mayteni]GIG99383.1 N-acetyltransferase [Plantactinospora mayteni]